MLPVGRKIRRKFRLKPHSLNLSLNPDCEPEGLDRSGVLSDQSRQARQRPSEGSDLRGQQGHSDETLPPCQTS